MWLVGVVNYILGFTHVQICFIFLDNFQFDVFFAAPRKCSWLWDQQPTFNFQIVHFPTFISYFQFQFSIFQFEVFCAAPRKCSWLSNQQPTFNYQIVHFSVFNFYFLLQFSIFQFEVFLRRQESVPDCPTSGQLSTFWQFFWEIHSHWCLAASLAITFFPNVFQLCTPIHFKMMMFYLAFKIRAWAFSLLVGETSKELDFCGLGTDIDDTWQHPVTQYNTKIKGHTQAKTQTQRQGQAKHMKNTRQKKHTIQPRYRQYQATSWKPLQHKNKRTHTGTLRSTNAKTMASICKVKKKHSLVPWQWQYLTSQHPVTPLHLHYTQNRKRQTPWRRKYYNNDDYNEKK